MARPNRSKSTDEQAPEQAPTEDANTEQAAETPVDLSAFEAQVTDTLTQADTSTGALPEAAVKAVNAEYRELDTKGKAAARKTLDEGMLAAVQRMDPIQARGYSDLRAQLTAGGGTSTPKAPADPTEAYVNKRTALQLATALVTQPEGLADDAEERITKLYDSLGDDVVAYRNWLEAETPEGQERPEPPEVNVVVKQAFKLSAGRVTGAGRPRGSTSGPRKNVAAHIASAFADKASGDFLTISEIAGHRSEEYGDTQPSQGAISARLSFDDPSKCNVEGVRPVNKGERNGSNPKGAVKV